MSLTVRIIRPRDSLDEGLALMFSHLLENLLLLIFQIAGYNFIDRFELLKSLYDVRFAQLSRAPDLVEVFGIHSRLDQQFLFDRVKAWLINFGCEYADPFDHSDCHSPR